MKKKRRKKEKTFTSLAYQVRSKEEKKKLFILSFLLSDLVSSLSLSLVSLLLPWRASAERCGVRYSCTTPFAPTRPSTTSALQPSSSDSCLSKDTERNLTLDLDLLSSALSDLHPKKRALLFSFSCGEQIVWRRRPVREKATDDDDDDDDDT